MGFFDFLKNFSKGQEPQAPEDKGPMRPYEGSTDPLVREEEEANLANAAQAEDQAEEVVTEVASSDFGRGNLGDADKSAEM